MAAFSNPAFSMDRRNGILYHSIECFIRAPTIAVRGYIGFHAENVRFYILLNPNSTHTFTRRCAGRGYFGNRDLCN